jgi:histidine triad (HIT) family protein
VAPVHILIVPKMAYPDLQSVPAEELSIVAECVAIAQQLAEEFEVADGYRFLTNNGPEAGQCVFHLHFHLIGGRKLGHLG